MAVASSTFGVYSFSMSEWPGPYSACPNSAQSPVPFSDAARWQLERMTQCSPATAPRRTSTGALEPGDARRMSRRAVSGRTLRAAGAVPVMKA
jgi:hypothetical protein